MLVGAVSSSISPAGGGTAALSRARNASMSPPVVAIFSSSRKASWPPDATTLQYDTPRSAAMSASTSWRLCSAGKSQSLLKLTTSQRQRLRARAARNAAGVSPRSNRSIAIDSVT